MRRAGAHDGGRLPSSSLRRAVLASRSNSREAKKRLMETDHPSRMVILSDQRETKDLSSDQIRKPQITPGTRAKKRLMETQPSSRVHLSLTKHRTLEILIETLGRFSQFQTPSAPRRGEPDDWERSAPHKAGPKREPDLDPPITNRSYRRLEFNISPTKQRTEVLSNRS
jgi:hypothetical protein